MTSLRIVVQGDQALLRKLNTPALMGPPLRRFMDRVTISVQGAARERTPVDTGRLRNSITARVDPSAMPSWGRVGTNVAYGVFVHEGTRPHWPPPGALDRWGARHGIDPFLVARAIARRGTRPRPFLRDGWAAVQPLVPGFVRTMSAEVAARWKAR